MEEYNFYNEFFKKIRTRVLFHNKNWLSIITGDTGSGKSYSALTMAKEISNNIHIVFTPLEFLKVLNKDTIKKGDVIIFDEAGVGMSSREWYSVQNKLLGVILQTFRNMNLAVIFTTPDLSFIDVQARKLFHHYFETITIDREKELCIVKPFSIDSDGRTGKTYYKYTVIKFPEDNHNYILKRLAFKKPDEKTIAYYESLKSAYTKKLNREALEELSGNKLNSKEEQALKVKNRLKEVEGLIIKNKSKYLKTYGKREFIDVQLIRMDFDLSVENSKLIKKAVESKI